MAFKIFAFLACVAVARAGLIPAVAHPVLERSDENDPNPQYTFGYDIQDALSGDSKNQYETRDGDSVRGQYSLNDADGFRRIVDYTADSVNGFNAIVRKEPIGVAVKTVAAAPTATLIKSAPAQLAYAAAPAPTLIKTAAYSAPIVHAPTVIQSTGNAIVKTTYSSPIASYAY